MLTFSVGTCVLSEKSFFRMIVCGGYTGAGTDRATASTEMLDLRSATTVGGGCPDEREKRKTCYYRIQKWSDCVSKDITVPRNCLLRHEI